MGPSEATPPGVVPIPLPLLGGAVVQQAHAGERAVVLKVRQPGVTTFLVAVAADGTGARGAIGLLPGRPPRPEGARSLGHLEGFRVAWVRETEVGLARGDERARIDATRGARVEVKVGPQVWTDAEREPSASEEERETWLARGAALAGNAAQGALEARRRAALQAVKRGVARLRRRAEAVRGDMARIGDAEDLAGRAQWLVAEASRAPRGARALTVTDWSSGEAKTLEVPLDPSKPARVQVEAMFKRARRLKLGAKIAGERLGQTEAALGGLAPIEQRIAAAEDVAEIDAALGAARALAPRDVKIDVPAAPGQTRAAAGRTQQPKSPPFRTFHARSGARLLVGRGAAQNDILTFQVGRPHDLWLHAKGHSGAHVIVPLAKSQTCPGDVLADAAHLAAHFSGARDEAVVEVAYADRRYVRKPRGSVPGLVVVDREKVIAVRIDAGVLRTLLESEEA